MLFFFVFFDKHNVYKRMKCIFVANFNKQVVPFNKVFFYSIEKFGTHSKIKHIIRIKWAYLEMFTKNTRG